ncbi:MAG: J domain-containing protein [Planctomycetes bacterium]|nr:J domain-containing protein [Planctomycetota bacterium]
MEFQDYYEILGVARDAAPDAIKKAFRRLAMKWHPDRHRENKAAAETAFKRVSEAYEVLSDPATREKYDRLGRDWKQGQSFKPPPESGSMNADEFARTFGGSGFSDFFGSLFGDELRSRARGRARHPRFRHRGADVRAELPLTLGDAIRGGTRSFSLSGRATCVDCGGTGRASEHVCARCGGVGAVHRERAVELKIPDRVRHGATLRLAGLGEPGEDGAEPGDLYLTVRLESDATYRLAGADIEAVVPIALREWLDGASVDVATLDGVAAVKIPKHFRFATRLRLRGMGLPRADGSRGEFFVVPVLSLPKEPDPALLEQLRKVAREPGADSSTAIEGGARVRSGS